MQVDANEVIRELTERIAKQEVELATLRVLLRQEAARSATQPTVRPEPEIDIEEMNRP